MPIPNTAFFRMYVRSVGQIVSGNFSQSDIGTPPPISSQEQLSAYFLAGVDNPATAPRLHQSVNVGGNWVPAAGTYELQFFPKSQIIFDAFGTPTTIDVISANFPLGAVFSQMYVQWNGFATYLGRNRQLTNWKLKARGSTVLDLIPNADFNGDGPPSTIFPDQFSDIHWGITQVLGSTTGLSATIIDVVNGSAPSAQFRTDTMSIVGVYRLLHFSTTMNPANQNAGPGGEVTINGTGLLELDQFSVTWPDSTTETGLAEEVIIPQSMILAHTNILLTIRIPYHLIPYAGTQLMIMGSQIIPTSFFGSAILGIVNIQLVDGSGLYTLVPGKRNDTYYDRSTTPSTTIDLKIPDPFGKTGYSHG